MLLLLICMYLNQAIAQEVVAYPSSVNTHLLQNSITGIAKDDRGILWVTTQFGVLKTDGATTALFSSGNFPSFSSNRFLGIFRHWHSGQLLFVNENLDIFTAKNGTLVPLVVPENALLFFDMYHWCILAAKKLTSVPSEFDLHRKSIIQTYLLSVSKSDTLVSLAEHLIYSFRLGKMLQLKGLPEKKYIYSCNGHFYLMEGDRLVEGLLDKDVMTFKKTNYSIFPFLKLPIYGDDHRFWFSNGKGLWRFNAFAGKADSLLNVNGNELKKVISVYEDTGIHKLYLGTFDDGLLEITKPKAKLVSPVAEKMQNYIYSYAVNPDDGNSLYTITHIALVKLFPDKKPEILCKVNGNSSCIYYHNNMLWFGTLDYRLCCWDIQKKQLTKTVVFNDEIKEIRSYAAGVLLVLTTHGIFLYDQDTRHTDTLFKIQGAENISYNTVHLAGRDTLLAGTTAGLYRYDVKRKKCIETILPGKSVRSILQYNDSVLVVGTYGYGCFFYRNGHPFNLPNEKSGFMLPVINLVKDKDGFLWVFSNKGVAKIHPDLLLSTPDNPGNYIYYFEIGTDLPIKELNGGQVMQNPDSNQPYLWMPGSEGMLCMNEQDRFCAFPVIKPLIAEIKIDTTLYAKLDSLDIDPRHYNINIKVEAPYYSIKNNFHLRYRLLGLDSVWEEMPAGNIIHFSRLPHGRYTLQLSSPVRYGSDSSRMYAISFSVSPFWYQRTVILIVFIVLLPSLIILIILLRNRYISRLNNKLQQLVEVRTKELRDNVVLLKASEMKITEQYNFRSKMYRILMHDLKSPLLFLSNSCIDLYNDIRRYSNVYATNMKVIAKTSTDLKVFIEEFLFWLNGQEGMQPVQKRKTNVHELILDITELYENIISLNNNKIFYFCTDENREIITDPYLIKIIVRNFIDNANKYTENGIIKVTLTYTDTAFKVQVDDSGKGIPENILSFIRNFKSADKDRLPEFLTHSMGVKIALESIEKLGGHVDFQSAASEGTMVTITFPLSG